MALGRFRRNGDDTTTDPAEGHPLDGNPDAPPQPGLRSVLVPLVVVLLVGVLTAAAFVGAYRSFRPHGVPVAIAGPQGAVDVFKQRLGGDDPIFEIQGVPAGSTAGSLVESREVYASLVLGEKDWQLQLAGANGTIINSQLASAFRPASDDVSYQVIDLAPSAKGDPSGWSVFFMTLSVVLVSFGFAVLLATRSPRLPVRVVRQALGIFSVLIGALAVFLIRYVFDALSGSPVLPFLLQSLMAFSVAALTYVLIRAGRVVGGAVAALLFVTAGTALSGSLLPPPFLVPALQNLVEVLPFGLAAQSTTAAAYFGGSTFGTGLYGLIGWTLVALVALAVLRRTLGEADGPRSNRDGGEDAVDDDGDDDGSDDHDAVADDAKDEDAADAEARSTS
jgi:hypothetical protein